MNERTNVSVYHKIPTIHIDNIAAIILQKTINLLYPWPWRVFAVATGQTWISMLKFENDPALDLPFKFQRRLPIISELKESNRAKQHAETFKKRPQELSAKSSC